MHFLDIFSFSVCDPNAEQDDLERAAKSSNPMMSANAAGLKGDCINVDEFGHLCVEASMITLLLKLKNFLRKAYSISETRITEYLPSEKERICEKGVSILDGAMFDGKVEPIFEDFKTKDQRKIDWNAAIRTYATFRILMREGDAGDSTLQVCEASPQKKRGKRKRDELEPASQVSPETD